MAQSRIFDAPAPSSPPPGGNRRIYRIAAIAITAMVAAALFLGLLQFRVISLLLLVYAGVLLAILLHTFSEMVARLTGLKHGWSLTIVLVVLVGLASLGLWLAAPPLSVQIAELVRQIPQAVNYLQHQLDQYSWSRYLISKIGSSGGALTPVASGWLDQVTGIASTTIDIIVQIVVVLFVATYLAAEPDLYMEGLVRLVPPTRRARIREVLATIAYTLRWWLIGQGIIMVVLGTIITIGLWMLSIPLALVLGVLGGLLDFVPYLGPVIAFSLAALLALTISPEKVLHVLALFVVAQIIEGYILTPLVQRRAILLPPALTIVIQVLMGWLVGSLGVVLAAPLTATIIVMVKMLYVEDTLGDKLQVPGEQEAKGQVAEQQKAEKADADDIRHDDVQRGAAP